MKKQLDLARKSRPAQPPAPPKAAPETPKPEVVASPPPPVEIVAPAKSTMPPQDLDRPYKSGPSEGKEAARPQLLFPLLIVVILLMIGFVFYLYVSS